MSEGPDGVTGPRPGGVEVNFDGIVGPTHNFAGLSPGNLASRHHAGLRSDPRAAALQGIDKMRLLLRLGVPQAVLPPGERPSPVGLAALGFDPMQPARALRRLAEDSPWQLASVMSASAMWAANAATVSPSVDTADGRVHLTPANLISTLHRSFEVPETTTALRAIFADPHHFVVHDPLPRHEAFADEGAANHSRFDGGDDRPGVHLFIYGREAGTIVPPGAFPRRQTRLASETIARSHGLDPTRTRFWAQNPTAIEAGAFHNDVVAVANGITLLAHEQAFTDPVSTVVEGLGALLGLDELNTIEVPRSVISLDDAIRSYLFNSQLVTLPDRTTALVAPDDVLALDTTRHYLDELLHGPSPIDVLHTVAIRQSMSNGGGPACLRLRVVLTPDELGALAGSVVVDEAMLDQLEAWVRRHYRDELAPADLSDPSLIDEVRTALDALTDVLGLGSIYFFQH